MWAVEKYFGKLLFDYISLLKSISLHPWKTKPDRLFLNPKAFFQTAHFSGILYLYNKREGVWKMSRLHNKANYTFKYIQDKKEQCAPVTRILSLLFEKTLFAVETVAPDFK